MMSETLFIFLSLLAILIVLLVVKQRIGAKRKWVFWIVAIAYGFLIAYMYLVRTMGVSLILSLAFWLGIITIRELIKWRRSLKTEVEKAKKPFKKLWRRFIFWLIFGIFCTSVIIFTLNIAGAFDNIEKLYREKYGRCTHFSYDKPDATYNPNNNVYCEWSFSNQRVDVVEKDYVMTIRD